MTKTWHLVDHWLKTLLKSHFFSRQTPPNYILGLAPLDALCITLYWTSAVKYSYKIAPPTLIGTMAAITGSINWIIGT